MKDLTQRPGANQTAAHLRHTSPQSVRLVLQRHVEVAWFADVERVKAGTNREEILQSQNASQVSLNRPTLKEVSSTVLNKPTNKTEGRNSDAGGLKND